MNKTMIYRILVALLALASCMGNGYRYPCLTLKKKESCFRDIH